MTREGTAGGREPGGGILGPLLAASTALGAFDALVTAGHGAVLPGSSLAAMAAGAFLLDFGAALALGALLLRLALPALGRERVDARLAWPWRLLAAALLRPREPATAAVLHRAWKAVSGLLPALAALGAVAWFAGRTFVEPIRTALFVAFAGLPAALVARAAGRALWSRLVADPAAGDGRWPFWVGPLSAALLAGSPVAIAAWALARRDEVFGAVDPWPAAAAAVFLGVLGLAIALGRLPHRAPRRSRFLRPVSVALAAAAVVVGAALLSGSAQAYIALRRGPGLARALHTAVARLLDADRDGHPFLLGGDCAPFDPAVHPLAADIPGDGRDGDCDGEDGPSGAAPRRDPLKGLPALAEGDRGGILLVVIDAARADHLSLYGYGRPTTPNLDRFAGNAVVFDRFFAVGNHTALSLPAILTGRPPSTRPRVRDVNWHGIGIRIREKPVSSRLAARGWRALFFPGHYMKGYLTGFEARLPRGRGHEPARTTARRIAEALRRMGPSPDKPVIVGAHFMGPHHPFRAPEKPDRFGRAPADRYDAELAHVDEALAPLLAMMERPGWDRWLVAITSDHGEAFGEHGIVHHGFTLHDEELRVPLVLRVPGIAGRRERTPAGHLDLVPTLVDWAAGPAPRDLPGASLLGLAARGAGEPPLERLVFSESYRRGDTFSVRDGRRTLILHAEPWLFELYDDGDPRQRRDLFSPGAAPDLRAPLLDHARRATAAIAGNEAR